MSKRLTKTIWYGSGVDSNGNPILPSNNGGLDGLNYGELYLHLSNGKASLWTLSLDGKIVEITGGGSEVDMSSYLLKSIWDKVFEIRTDSQGTEYIFGKLPMVTQYGITMYSGDGVDVPSLASGLPFDGRTIWYNPDTQQIEVIGGTGGGSGEGVSNFWDLSGIPSWITNSKPKYTYSEIEGTPDLSGFATLNWIISQGYASAEELKKYIPISGYTEVSGEKNFTGGLKVNGSPIYYDTEKKYWKLEGDLLVTGGITMYGNEGTYTPSTIMDAIAVDGTTISKSGGVLKVIGGTGGGVADSVAWANITGKPNFALVATSGKYDDLIGKPTLLSSFTDDVVSGKYLPLSGGELKGVLTINTSAIHPMIVSSSGMGYKSYIAYRNGATSGEDMGSLGFNGKNVPSFRTNSTEGGKEYKLLHENNYSSFALPLSGGTITASNGVYIVDFNSTDGKFCVNSYQINGVNKGDIGYLNNSGRAAIYMFNKTGNAAICVGDDGEIYKGISNNFSLYKIWHSGNDGSSSGLDADLLDGKHDGYVIAESLRNRTNDNSSIVLYSATRTDNTWPRSIVDNGYGLMIASNNTTGYIATLNSNVASATKLQTARTIWGQSFDGTGNIDGVITINQSTTNASILINSTHASLPQSFITFQSNRVDKGNVGWTNASGTHLYNASTRKTLELTNDGELKYGAVANGAVIWRADNSNLPTVNWTASDLYCYCNGAERQFVVSKKSYTWGGMVNLYPLIGTTSTADNNIYTMLAFPHIPYLKNGSRNYNGNSFGSLVRFEGDVTNGKYWDVGCPQESPNNLFIKCDGKNIASWGDTGLMGIYVPNQWLSNSMLVLGRKDSSLMTTQYAQIGITDGNLHLDAYKGKGIYLNFYQSNTGVVIDKDCNLLVSGGITMYSDQRKKTIINHVELSLKEIAEAPLIEHYYNSDEKKTTHVGSIAQYWASINDWFCKLDSEGFYTMEIQNAALASAISIARELDRYETKTDKAIKKLKQRICELEEEVERLKSAA